MSNEIAWNEGSFRDPSGNVFLYEDHVYRAVSKEGFENFQAFSESGLRERFEQDGRLVTSRVSTFEESGHPGLARNWEAVLEHERISPISYPFEWPFSLLQRAALLQLDLLIESLPLDITLSDAASYNIQYQGTTPRFIDVGSFIPYEPNTPWLAHRQFCEQFLNPLLLTAKAGIPYHAWLRGSLNGLPSTEIARLLPWTSKFSMNTLVHVHGLARLHKAEAQQSRGNEKAGNGQKGISRDAQILMLQSLRKTCEGLSHGFEDGTNWLDYEKDNSYDSTSNQEKIDAIAAFCQTRQPQRVLDLGCNAGFFSEVALSNGARQAIGIDGDLGALERGVQRSDTNKLDFLPLYMDLTNPSPSMGWASTERPGFTSRIKPDGLMALALIHHLVIGANIPLPRVLGWLTGMAPCGVIEFVPKSDVMVRHMLSTRRDIFPDYTLEHCQQALTGMVKNLDIKPLSSGRTLFIYER